MRIPREDLGWALHTASRKLMDSKQSVAIWNLINVLPEQVWASYLDTVWEALEATPEDKAKTVTDIVKEVSCDWFNIAKTKIYDTKTFSEYRDWDEKFSKDGGSHYAHAMQAIFTLFSDDDWEGYCYWLENE